LNPKLAKVFAEQACELQVQRATGGRPAVS
jgi:hypothetical protein